MGHLVRASAVPPALGRHAQRGGRWQHLDCLRVRRPDLYLRAVPSHSNRSMQRYAWCAGQLVYAYNQTDSIVALPGPNNAEG
jgi:hypothetical protein